jgi:hypothetical protein
MGAVAAGAAALALAFGAAACGGDDGGAEAPASASLAPADAPVFAEATVRPQGDQAESAESALSKLLNTDEPGGFIVEQIDNLLADEDLDLSYSEDIEPWLGESAGIFFTSFGDEPDGAAVVEVTDEAAAQAAIDKLREAEGSRATDQSYEGVDYQLDDDDTATGFVEGFLVLGTERGFRAAVDASRGESLAEEPEFRDRLEGASGDSLATVYAHVPSLLGARVDAGELDARSRASFEAEAGAIAEGPALASIGAESDALELQTVTASGELSSEQSELLPDLPADSWFAFAIPRFGDYLGQAIDAQGGRASTLDADVRALLGLDLDQLVGWIGDVGGYAAGTSIFGIGGALVLETTDEAASTKALGGIARTLARDRSLEIRPSEGGDPGFTINPSDAPIQIVVTQREGRVIAGLGERSVDDALGSEQTLGDSDAYSSAVETLGPEYSPALFLDFAPLLELLDSVGADEDADLRSAMPYLDHLEYLVSGWRTDGDQDVSRTVLGLR